MKKLLFSVNQQSIKRIDTLPVISDALNYFYIKVDFDVEWDGLIKHAVFKSLATGDTFDVILVSDECEIPPQITNVAGKFSVSVYGGDLHTTDSIYIEVFQSGYEVGEPPAPPEPTQNYVKTFSDESGVQLIKIVDEEVSFYDGTNWVVLYKAAELQRIANEGIRISQEEARELAEGLRVGAEITRESNEIARAVWEIYDNTKQYKKGNKVSYQGSSYIASEEPPIGTLPTDILYYTMIASKGVKGDTGEVSLAQLNVVDNKVTSLKEEYTNQRQQDQLKVATVEKGLNDYKSTMASVNVNQEAKQKVTGYGTISLPKNAANGQVGVGVEGRTLKNELNYNRDTWAEWTKSAGIVGDTTGLEITATNGSFIVAGINTNIKPATKYGILIYTVSNSLVKGLVLDPNAYLGMRGVVSALGNTKFVKTTLSNITINKLNFTTTNSENTGNKIKIKDIRIFELPTGSEIENDFNTMTADQLAQKYPYIKGDSAKSTISASRLKSVDKDGIQESISYLPNVGELRSLPNGVRDEIKVSGGKAELVKRVSDTMEELAEPITTPIEVSGTLLSNPSGTIFIEKVLPVAGIYTDEITIIHTDFPISSLGKISKVDFTTGVETQLDVSKAVVATDKLSFTHTDLTSGDIVFFEYFYANESTQGELEIEYYDSRHVLKDSVTGKFYKIIPTVANGVLTNGLLEV